MSKRLTSDSANTVSLFPFLAVLLCTMGALLVLLVVLAQRAGQRSLADAEPAISEPAAVAPTSFELSDDPGEAEELRRQLEELRTYQAQLEQVREQGQQKLAEEKERLSYLESQTRALEHELARLAIAVEQLRATEDNQAVDQQQAERELDRLKQLIADTEEQLESLREESLGKRSYAIVPYVGPNGTLRQPVYLECQKDAIVLHPAGVRFLPSDFMATSWPGNPLAAVLRATRKHINAQAAKLGESEPPDPYPLILVRPEGIPMYLRARAAISSWDSSFGYEFIDSDWNLELPDGLDPLLASEQQHALLLSRDRLAKLVRSAPRQFQGVAGAGGGPGARRSDRGAGGFGGSSVYDGDGGYASQRSGTLGGSGESPWGADGSGGDVGQAGQHAGAGEMASLGGGPAGGVGSEPNGGLEQQAFGATGFDTAGSSGTAGGGTQQGGQQGGAGAAQGLASAGSGQPGSSGSAGGGSPRSGGGASAGGSSSGSAGGQGSSIAETHGQNWAVDKSGRGAVPIRRTIQVVVREDHIALLPSRHASIGQAARGTEISLNQSAGRIAEQFVGALRGRVKDWGLAGQGLYWRPVLQLNVGPDAQQTAHQVMRLLKDSGVEVSLPETARAPGGGQNAPR